MFSLEQANATIAEMERKIRQPVAELYSGKLYVGVDLGTANIVVTVLDENKRPLAGAMQEGRVVKDGLVVDFLGAIQIVRSLVTQLEERLGRSLETAAVAIPPGTLAGDVRAIINVVQAVGLEVNQVVDEPTAAATVLGIQSGAVVDVGGGTTGISVLDQGKVVYVADEPTGGTHINLVLAGAYKIGFEEAELKKRDPAQYQDVFPVIVPVIEKVASIIQHHLAGQKVESVYLVGGTVCLEGFEKVVSKFLGIPVFKPYNPLLVTPLGIAGHCR